MERLRVGTGRLFVCMWVVLVPCCSYNRQTDAEGNAQACPSNRGNGLDESADL